MNLRAIKFDAGSKSKQARTTERQGPPRKRAQSNSIKHERPNARVHPENGRTRRDVYRHLERKLRSTAMRVVVFSFFVRMTEYTCASDCMDKPHDRHLQPSNLHYGRGVSNATTLIQLSHSCAHRSSHLRTRECIKIDDRLSRSVLRIVRETDTLRYLYNGRSFMPASQLHDELLRSTLAITYGTSKKLLVQESHGVCARVEAALLATGIMNLLALAPLPPCMSLADACKLLFVLQHLQGLHQLRSTS